MCLSLDHSIYKQYLAAFWVQMQRQVICAPHCACRRHHLTSPAHRQELVNNLILNIKNVLPINIKTE